MRFRFLPLLALACAVSGCASVQSAFTDSPSEAAIVIPKSTPEQAYNAGVLFQERGDYDAARREWDRCVAMSPPDSPSRVDCMIALERAAAPSAATEP
jgi:hypothetical protein